MKTREFYQRVRDHEHLVETDGPFVAIYTKRTMLTHHVVSKKVFKGETSLQDADREFTDQVFKEMYG